MIEVYTTNHSAIHRVIHGYTFYKDADGTPHPKHSLGYAFVSQEEARRLRAELSRVFEGADPLLRMSDGWQAPPLIVTRHEGVVSWLRQRGITGEVVSHVTDAAQVRDRVVYGALPLHLAAFAAEVVAIDLPNLSPELRGQDLTPEQMDAAGAVLATYVVRKV